MKKPTIEEIEKLVTFTRAAEGNLQIGDVKGNVWGDVWGDVGGNVKGNVKGNVLGDVWGDVKGSQPNETK